jgi:hypothetical protein
MHKQRVCGVVVVALLGFLALAAWDTTAAEKSDGAMLSHDVYFTLKDNSAKAKKILVAACKKYLSKHSGEVFFAVGTRVTDLKRPVNDQDWDVALHIVFKNRAAHDKYQDHGRHKLFIKGNKGNWKKVRVFDAVVK